MARMQLRRAALLALVCALLLTAGAQAQGRQGQGGEAAMTPRAEAPFDPTGYWVAIISEDWRWRMITPARGDFPSIPMNLEAQHVAEAWDPATDEAAGEQCKAYGAPGLIRGPTRLHITWLDDSTLKVESDYGMQTRLLHFGTTTPTQGANTWQGVSTAEWTRPNSSRGGQSPAAASRFGSLKAVTTQLRPGYLRKNGVPYSANTVFTEYWDLHTETNGDQYLVDTNSVVDPDYLQIPFVTAIHFKKEPDGSKWDPTACDARF